MFSCPDSLRMHKKTTNVIIFRYLCVCENVMSTRIAVATVSGKAYYLLVNELKKRGISFLSLVPHEIVPLDVEVVITTFKERHLVQHPKILVYEDKTNPAKVVDEAFRIIGGNKHYEPIVVGVDPGKTFGVAVLCEGNVLETTTCSAIEATVSKILDILRKPKSAYCIVRVGNGAHSITTKFLSLLDETLPDDVSIEVVNEAGTSRFIGEKLHKRGSRDALSAVKIAERRGYQYHRKKEKQPE
jgi:hypothetical protein